MVEPERKSAQEFEGLVSKIEASVGNREPLEFDGNDAGVLRESLKSAGVELDLGDKERDRLLTAPMFRAKVELDEEGSVSGVLVFDYSKPKGERWAKIDDFDAAKLEGFEEERSLGVHAAIREENFRGLVTWAYTKAKEENYPGKIGGKEGTEGRGLQQAAADLLAISVLDPDSENFTAELREATSRLNRRLWRGFRKTLEEKERASVDRKFREAEVEEPVKTLASFPPSALPQLLRFLAQK